MQVPDELSRTHRLGPRGLFRSLRCGGGKGKACECGARALDPRPVPEDGFLRMLGCPNVITNQRGTPRMEDFLPACLRGRLEVESWYEIQVPDLHLPVENLAHTHMPTVPHQPLCGDSTRIRGAGGDHTLAISRFGTVSTTPRAENGSVRRPDGAGCFGPSRTSNARRPSFSGLSSETG